MAHEGGFIFWWSNKSNEYYLRREEFLKNEFKWRVIGKEDQSEIGKHLMAQIQILIPFIITAESFIVLVCM